MRALVAAIAVALVGCVDPAALDIDVGVSVDAARRDAHVGASDASSTRPDASVFLEPDAALPREDAGPGPLQVALGDAVTVAPTRPPALSGGTLLLSRDRALAIMSDPDRDRIVIVELATQAIATIALTAGDEPGRLAEDASGRVYVALRRGGAVVTLDLATRALLGRRATCPSPRGITYDEASDVLYLACASGELVTLPPGLAPATRTLHIDDDLRDVVVVGTDVFVSRFRAAQVLVVAPSGAVTRRIDLPASSAFGTTASVAWRMIPSPRGGVIVVHQQAAGRAITTSASGGYGSFGCTGGIVRSAVTEIVDPLAAPTSPMMLSGCAVLPVDAASVADGSLVVVAAGAAPLRPTQQLVGVLRDATTHELDRMGPVPHGMDAHGRIVAIALSGTGIAVAQTREPAGLWIDLPGATATYLALGGESALDTGFEVFHSDVGVGVACASCHPEAGDDGRVWSFDVGLRRTMPLRGGLLGTEPFHWAGELPDFDALVADVFAGRMSGGSLGAEQVSALAHWIDTSPLLPPRQAADVDAVARGQVLFESADLGCSDCHAGPRLSSEATVDVGTGGAFQTPSLRGLVDRAPYMHNGCAYTLRDRFDARCGGGDAHGHTSGLTSAQLDDLLAFLETL